MLLSSYPSFKMIDWLDTTSSLWLATLDINTSIEPVLIEECNPSPLYEDILRNGIAV